MALPAQGWKTVSIVDACFEALHRAGWSIGDSAYLDPSTGLQIWQVLGTNGEDAIDAQVPTQVESWRLAVEQATTAGMVGRCLPG